MHTKNNGESLDSWMRSYWLVAMALIGSSHKYTSKVHIFECQVPEGRFQTKDRFIKTILGVMVKKLWKKDRRGDMFSLYTSYIALVWICDKFPKPKKGRNGLRFTELDWTDLPGPGCFTALDRFASWKFILIGPLFLWYLRAFTTSLSKGQGTMLTSLRIF